MYNIINNQHAMGRQQKGSLMLLDKESDLHTFFCIHRSAAEVTAS